MSRECREMKWLDEDDLRTPRCPDCGGACLAFSGQGGVEECRRCHTVSLIVRCRESWAPHLPMMADYEINDAGTKRLLGWHPKNIPQDCHAKNDMEG